MSDVEPTARSSATLLHVTDPHLFAAADATVRGVRSAATFTAVLQQALAQAPGRVDGIIVTGDIADDLTDAAYERCRAALLATGLPTFCLAGNHDEPQAMSRLFAGERLQYLGEAQVGSWLLVLLDSHLPGETHGALGPERLAWLDARLQAAHDRPVLLALHHPPLPVGSAWIDSLALEDGAALLSLLERHRCARAVVCGHVHQASDQSRGTLRVLTTPSTCVQFAPHSDDFALDTRPPGWRWLHLHPDGSLATTVDWLRT